MEKNILINTAFTFDQLIAIKKMIKIIKKNKNNYFDKKILDSIDKNIDMETEVFYIRSQIVQGRAT